MKKLLVIFLVCGSMQLPAQEPITEIIRQGIKKVIIAVDLKIQRLQNQTIWLQHAQQTIENTLSHLHLTEIGDWAAKQRDLYAHYFDELRKVKQALSSYQRVRRIISQQVQVVKEYQAAWALFRQDKYLTPDELAHIFSVYTGMLRTSSAALDDLLLVVRSFVLQVPDAQRLDLIQRVAQQMETTLLDLKAFTEENKMLSLQRATEHQDIHYVKRLYGF